jgi:phage tail sheath protein FI
MGLRALIDEQTGPHKTLSNVAVSGVVGLTQDIHWDIEDMASDAGVLNAAQVTALIARTAASASGATAPVPTIRCSCSSTVRVAQLLADTVARGMVWAMDKDLTPSLARDIVETVNGFFLDLKTVRA